jgi:hypothetical protein
MNDEALQNLAFAAATTVPAGDRRRHTRYEVFL